jgi:hypothetical protein
MYYNMTLLRQLSVEGNDLPTFSRLETGVGRNGCFWINPFVSQRKDICFGNKAFKFYENYRNGNDIIMGG